LVNLLRVTDILCSSRFYRANPFTTFTPFTALTIFNTLGDRIAFYPADLA
jgi:hypothetical protein